MADFKKKNVKKLKTVKPKRSAVAENYKITSFDDKVDEIPVKSSKQVKAERRFEKNKSRYLKKHQPKKRIVNSEKSPSELNQNLGLKVLTGGKQATFVKRVVSLSVAFCIVLSIFIVQVVSPTGIIELISNSFSKMGSSSGFPVSIGGGTVLDIKECAGTVAVLSDTNLEIFNKDSKELFIAQHGCSYPVLQTTSSRALVYDEGATNISVYNLSGELFTRTMKEKIIFATLSYNGSYCVVTDPENAASMIYVYNKNNTLLFKYKFDSELICSAAISESGKKMAVVALNAEGGKYVSTINLFNIKNKEIYKEIEKDGLVYSVDAAKGKNFLAYMDDSLIGIMEKDGTYSVLEESGIQHKNYASGKGNAVIYGIEGADESTSAVIYKNKLEKAKEFKIKTIPQKLVFNRDFLCFSKDTYLYVYGEDDLEIEIKCDYSAEKFTLIGDKIYIINNEVLTCLNIMDYKEEK